MFPRRSPKVLCHAEFTRDMIENLLTVYEMCQVDGVVTVEVADFGLWAPRNDGLTRVFLGQARLPEEPTPGKQDVLQ